MCKIKLIILFLLISFGWLIAVEPKLGIPVEPDLLLQKTGFRNHYRPHAGLNGNMVLPYRQDAEGEIQEISFLGGLLHGYRRVKQAA